MLSAPKSWNKHGNKQKQTSSLETQITHLSLPLRFIQLFRPAEAATSQLDPCSGNPITTLDQRVAGSFGDEVKDSDTSNHMVKYHKHTGSSIMYQHMQQQLREDTLPRTPKIMVVTKITLWWSLPSSKRVNTMLDGRFCIHTVALRLKVQSVVFWASHAQPHQLTSTFQWKTLRCSDLLFVRSRQQRHWWIYVDNFGQI